MLIQQGNGPKRKTDKRATMQHLVAPRDGEHEKQYPTGTIRRWTWLARNHETVGQKRASAARG